MRQQLRDISRVARIGCSALTVQIQVAITWRGAPPKVGTPGDISPPIRPSTATSQAPRVGCCANHIRARPQISCRSPQPHSWNRPLPTWDLQLLPTEPPGALWASARIHHGFPASPASQRDTERAIPSSRLPEADVCSFRTAGPTRKDNSGYGCPRDTVCEVVTSEKLVSIGRELGPSVTAI